MDNAIDSAPNYTASGGFMDDVIWKLRGQLALLASLDADGCDSQVIHGVHAVATECMIALDHIEAQRLGWAPTPDPVDQEDAADE